MKALIERKPLQIEAIGVPRIGNRLPVNMVDQTLALLSGVLKSLGYGGTWRARFLRQKPSFMQRFSVARKLPDEFGIVVKTRPGDNATCWELVISPPPHLDLDEVFEDLKGVKIDGSVPIHMRRLIRTARTDNSPLSKHLDRRSLIVTTPEEGFKQTHLPLDIAPTRPPQPAAAPAAAKPAPAAPVASQPVPKPLEPPDDLTDEDDMDEPNSEEEKISMRGFSADPDNLAIALLAISELAGPGGYIPKTSVGETLEKQCGIPIGHSKGLMRVLMNRGYLCRDIYPKRGDSGPSTRGYYLSPSGKQFLGGSAGDKAMTQHTPTPKAATTAAPANHQDTPSILQNLLVDKATLTNYRQAKVQKARLEEELQQEAQVTKQLELQRADLQDQFNHLRKRQEEVNRMLEDHRLKAAKCKKQLEEVLRAMPPEEVAQQVTSRLDSMMAELTALREAFK